VRLGEAWQATGVVSQFARETPWNGGYRMLVRWQNDLVKSSQVDGDSRAPASKMAQQISCRSSPSASMGAKAIGQLAGKAGAMCIFSALVNSVNNTHIFARHADEGRQHLVYSMAYDAPHDLSMILPLPTPPAARRRRRHLHRPVGLPGVVHRSAALLPGDTRTGEAG
jgi:hypothetical protein